MKNKGATGGRNKKIHKRLTSNYLIAMDVLCGRWVQYRTTSYTWNKVTCKDCLKKGDLKEEECEK